MLTKKTVAIANTEVSLTQQNKMNGLDTSIIVDLRNRLFKIMSTQNLNNLSATISQSEKTEKLEFTIGSTSEEVQVVSIVPNGSCFFGSIAHQYFGLKVNSKLHQEKTKELRRNVVAYIQSNFKEFQFKIQGRVYDAAKHKIDKSALESECRVFLNACLPLETCFAGDESFNAISNILNINIITISENGEAYMGAPFNKSFDRIAFVGHRLRKINSHTSKVHNDDRNHYDSVTEINNEVLFKLSEHLSKMIAITEQNGGNNTSIISLNSSIE